MNRWTGTGHLTKDPKFLETNGGTAICALRIAVKRAGKQGNDGYFDILRHQVLRRPGARLRRLPEGRARGRGRRPPALRRVPNPGRLLRLPRLHRRRAVRVPRQRGEDSRRRQRPDRPTSRPSRPPSRLATRSTSSWRAGYRDQAKAAARLRRPSRRRNRAKGEAGSKRVLTSSAASSCLLRRGRQEGARR